MAAGLETVMAQARDGVVAGSGTTGDAHYHLDVRVLFVCTANICRSPMAAALFTAHARRRGASPEVLSAGTDAGRASMPDRPPPEVYEVMAPRGIDLHEHQSRALSEGVLLEADLVIGMARRHVQESVLLDPSCFTRAFTLKELVRRAGSVGSPPTGDELARWVGVAHGDRTRVALARRDTADDIADPYGGPLTAYRECALELDELTMALATLLWPVPER